MGMNAHEVLLPALRGWVEAHRPLDWPDGLPVRLELDDGERELPCLVLTIQDDVQQHRKIMRVGVGLEVMCKADEGRDTAMRILGGLQRAAGDTRALLDWLNDPLKNPAACSTMYRRWWPQGIETEIDDRRNWILRWRVQLFLVAR
jgi:hypothetical protein